jgi:hypothetical protein
MSGFLAKEKPLSLKLERHPIREASRYGRYPSGSINSFTLFSATSGEVPEFQRGGGNFLKRLFGQGETPVDQTREAAHS